MSTLAERLREERDRLGFTQVAFAALAGAKKHSQINYELGRTSPDADYLIAIAEAGADSAYILTGRREKPLDTSSWNPLYRAFLEATNPAYAKPLALPPPSGRGRDSALGEAFAAIPRYDVRLSAGAGAANESPEQLEPLAFRRAWLNRLSIAPEQAVILSIVGDSMEPGLHHGDLALIDTARATPRSGRVYAITDIDGSTRVKRLDLVPQRGYILRSDNPAHSAELRLDDEARRLVVIGLLVWSGHTLNEV